VLSQWIPCSWTIHWTGGSFSVSLTACLRLIVNWPVSESQCQLTNCTYIAHGYSKTIESPRRSSIHDTNSSRGNRSLGLGAGCMCSRNIHQAIKSRTWTSNLSFRVTVAPRRFPRGVPPPIKLSKLKYETKVNEKLGQLLLGPHFPYAGFLCKLFKSRHS
jgi:hypothetical protein